MQGQWAKIFKVDDTHRNWPIHLDAKLVKIFRNLISRSRNCLDGTKKVVNKKNVQISKDTTPQLPTKEKLTEVKVCTLGDSGLGILGWIERVQLYIIHTHISRLQSVAVFDEISGVQEKNSGVQVCNCNVD